MIRFFSILFVFGFLGNHVLAQSYVEIGSGTVSTTYPVYSVWNYGWYAFILPQSSVGTSKTITKIAVNCINGPKNYSNQRIYMKHTSQNVFASAAYDDPVSGGYTLVYDGSINFNGWTEITLSTPFAYNGTDHLLIQWENRSGTTLYANFNSTTSTMNDNKSNGNDPSFPTGSGFLNPFPSSIPNVRLYYPSTAPATPTNPVPADNALKTDLNTDLSVTLGTNTTAYDLYLGTDSLQVAALNASLKVVNQAPVAAPGVYTFTPPAILVPGTNYFWKVVASDGSSTTASVVWQFTTQNVIQNFPYVQGFEGNDVFYPGWYGEFTDWNYPTAGNNRIWDLCSDVNAHSGLAGLAGNPLTATTESSIMTPRIFLPASYRVSFWWRNGNVLTLKTATTDTTYFEVTDDGGANWTTLGFLSPATSQSVMSQEYFDLSAYQGNNVYLRWRYVKKSSGADNVYIDDIQIEAIPSGAVISLSETTLQFDTICANAHTHLPLIIENTGVSDLVISSANVASPFTCSYTGTIHAGTADTLEVTISGAAPGSFSENLVFSHNGTGISTVQLNAVVLALGNDFLETFESVSPGQLPDGWGLISNGDPLHSAEVKNSPSDAFSVPNVVRMYNNSDSISPLIMLTNGVGDFDVNTLDFYAAKTFGNFSQVGILIGLMDDPYDASTFDTVQSIILNDTMTHYTVNFDSGNTKPYIAFRHAGLGDFQSIWIDDVSWQGVVNDAPDCATLVFPLDASNDQEKNIQLSWAPGAGSPEGYRISFGTINPPGNIFNNLDLGDTTSFSVQNLTYADEYFWKITPYNSFGDASGCPVWSFTVMDDPTLFVPWSEDFENVVQTSDDNKPLGWTIQNDNEAFMAWDLILNSAMSPDNAHSGDQAMHTGFTFLQPLEDWLITPPVMLNGGTEYSFSFWLKSPYYVESGDTTFEKLEVKWGSGAAVSDSLTEILYSNTFLRETDYIFVERTLTPTSSGVYYFGFRTFSDPLQWLVIIDDVAMDFVDGINDHSSFLSSVYPNPANSYIVIDSEISQADIEIHDVTGRLLENRSNASFPLQYDVQHLPQGLYFVVLKNDNSVQTLVFSKQ